MSTTRLQTNASCWCASGRKLERCHGDHARYRRPPVAPGLVGAPRNVPPSIERPAYVGQGKPRGAGFEIITADDEVASLRRACRVAAEVLAETGGHVRPGVTTDELDAVAHDAYIRRGAYPTTLRYGTYVKSICTSVNDIVCHGIPDDRPLREGDIVDIDVTAFIGGFHGDTSATFAVGDVDEPTAALVATTEVAMYAGIAAIRPGLPTRVIGAAVQSLAHRRGYGVVADYGGHGIGRAFHAAPHIDHVDAPHARTVMVPGMVFTVEPMVTAGTARHHQWPDAWTVATDDGLPSAQFEHTVIVTESGADILTTA